MVVTLRKGLSLEPHGKIASRPNGLHSPSGDGMVKNPIKVKAQSLYRADLDHDCQANIYLCLSHSIAYIWSLEGTSIAQLTILPLEDALLSIVSTPKPLHTNFVFSGDSRMGKDAGIEATQQGCRLVHWPGCLDVRETGPI